MQPVLGLLVSLGESYMCVLESALDCNCARYLYLYRYNYIGILTIP